VAKPELGTKRICGGCGAKFYDLNHDPISCPKCGTVYEVATVMTRGRPEQARAVAEPEAEVPEPVEAEFVSLEEADAEAQGGAKEPIAGADEDVEVDDESLDDAAFLVPEEDEDEDVSNIIGGEIEDDEET
jgi:uncharacterized protein (TIGR02300 family)